MTVKEMIDVLNTFDPNSNIWFQCEIERGRGVSGCLDGHGSVYMDEEFGVVVKVSGDEEYYD